ncbi:MAG TPA: DNA-3-methyladenine glycosylase [Thermoanaerobaculia bacterium]|nr:DNA-3-methyladenine glycosylase [Thermoanaerobaculia bacterium]
MNLPPDFFLQDTVTVARRLLGCILHHRIDGDLLSGRIVETEAYLGANDRASHARGGLRSARNESMYLEGGHAYVYFTYGMHFCMNVVTQQSGISEAVLLRAVEPLRGIERMKRNRAKAKREIDLTNGPGKLCQAMEIDRSLDGEWLRGERLWLTAPKEEIAEESIGISPRVGIDNSGDAIWWPLRFFIRSNSWVSRARIAEYR